MDDQSCRWGSPGTDISLILKLYDVNIDGSADSAAASEMKIFRSDTLCGSLRPQVGIGNEADVCTTTEQAGSSDQHQTAQFWARKHNVVIEIYYHYYGIRSEDDMTSLARQVAAEALAKVSF